MGYVLGKLFWLQVTETDLSQPKLKWGDSISMQIFIVSHQKKATLAEEGRRLGTGRLSISPVLTSASHLLASLLRHLLSLFLVLHTAQKEGSLPSLPSIRPEPQSSLAPR